MSNATKAGRTTTDFPFADSFNPEHVKTLAQAASNLREELAEGGYRRKNMEAADRKQLAKLEKWLKLVK